MPPGSPGNAPRPPVNVAAYQAAIAAASANMSAPRPSITAPSPNPNIPPGQGPLVKAPSPRPNLVRPAMPSTVTQQPQHRQTLVNRPQQLGSHATMMQAKPVVSPLLRPPLEIKGGPDAPSVLSASRPPSVPKRDPVPTSPAKVPVKSTRRGSTKQS